MENFNPRSPSQAAAMDAIAANPTGSFFLWGHFGGGKTHLATAQYRELVKLERPCLFLSMWDLVTDLRRAEVEEDYVSLARERSKFGPKNFHLFIDDLDKYKPTQFKTEVLFELFNDIYKRELHVTITSNESMQELFDAGVLHPGIVRRIDDMCLSLEV
jgi:DNA replication protein DnaC